MIDKRLYRLIGIQVVMMWAVFAFCLIMLILTTSNHVVAVASYLSLNITATVVYYFILKLERKINDK